jgi:hypothetical protein
MIPKKQKIIAENFKPIFASRQAFAWIQTPARHATINEGRR